MICLVRGSRKMEREILQRFRHLLIRGREWFADVREIRTYIESLVSIKNIPPTQAVLLSKTNAGIGSPIAVPKLGPLLMDIRKQKQMSIREMADAVGVIPHATYWRAEQGRKIMSATAWVIVERLGVLQLDAKQKESLASIKGKLVQK